MPPADARGRRARFGAAALLAAAATAAQGSTDTAQIETTLGQYQHENRPQLNLSFTPVGVPIPTWGFGPVRDVGSGHSLGSVFMTSGTSTSDAVAANAVSVANAAELSAALAAATDGDTIFLDVGDYGSLNLQGVHKDITLLADPDNPASFGAMRLDDVSGLTLDGLVFDFVYEEKMGTKTFLTPFKVHDSRNITIRNSSFEGDDAYGTGTVIDGYGFARAFELRRSENVEILDNAFHGFANGMKLGGSMNTVVRGNDIYDMGSDGIQMTLMSDTVIEGNHFHDFRTPPGSGYHSDFIQLLGGGEKVPTSGLTIRDNLFTTDEGGSQVIFLKNEDDTPWRDILIEENLIVATHPNAIYLGATDGLVIRNNSLLDSRLSDPSSHAPAIYVDGASTNVTITDNISAKLKAAVQPDWTVENNFDVQGYNPDAPGYYGDHFIAPHGDLSGYPEKLFLREDSPIHAAGAGSSRSYYDPAPETVMAIATLEATENGAAFVFDAAMSAGPDGALTDNPGSRFEWIFADGTRMEGPTVTRTFAGPGYHDVVLEVTDAAGNLDRMEQTVAVAGADILSFDAASGDLMAMAYGAETVLYDGAPGALDLSAIEGNIVLPRAAVEEIHNVGEFELEMTLTANIAEAPGAFGGEILRQHPGLLVKVTDGGEIVVRMKLQGGEQIKLDTSGARLQDGLPHEVRLEVEVGGAAELWVDGILHDSAEVDAALRGAEKKVVLGGAYGNEPFKGAISALSLRTDPDDYAYAPTDGLAPEDAADDAEDDAGLKLLDGPLMQAGTVEVVQADPDAWHTVTFEAPIENARVVMGPVSSNDTDPLVTRVRNVTDTGFEFQLQEWGYLDGVHAAETLGWVAGSAGTYTLASGQSISFGRLSTRDNKPGDVALEGLSEAPAVFAQVTSFAGGQAVTTRIEDVAAAGFSVRMQEEEANGWRHREESIDWMALEYGNAGMVDAMRADGIDHTGGVLNFDPVDELVFMAEMQTMNGHDTATTRIDTIGSDSVRVFIEEEASADAETAHLGEDVAAAVLQAGLYELTA